MIVALLTTVTVYQSLYAHRRPDGIQPPNLRWNSLFHLLLPPLVSTAPHTHTTSRVRGPFINAAGDGVLARFLAGRPGMESKDDWRQMTLKG